MNDKEKNKNIRILVVDDEPVLREVIAFDMGRLGYQVLEASNGREALEIAKRERVDVILSDVRMPGGDGIELLDLIKDHDPMNPAVILISGYADITREVAYHKGAEAFFSKPFDRKQLIAAVSKAATKLAGKWEPWEGQITCDFAIELRFSDLNVAVTGRALNLGRGGMFVALDAPFPVVGAQASFNIAFAGGEVGGVEGHGIVRWIRSVPHDDRPPGCGIEFMRLSDATRQKIVDLIDRTRARSFIPIG